MKRFVIESVKFISMITAGFLVIISFFGIITVGMDVFVLVLPQLETQVSTPIPNTFSWQPFHYLQGLQNGLEHFLMRMAPLGYFIILFVVGALVMVKGLKIAGKMPTYIDRIMPKFIRQRSEVLQNQSEEK